MIDVTYSNRIEELFLQYKNKLILQETDPFALRIIIVPSLGVKAWIEERLCNSEIGTSLGFKIILLDEALYTLKKLFTSSTVSQKVPSKMELAISIEKNLDGIGELSFFLNQTGKKELRSHHLSQIICPLFYKYGRISNEIATGWQKELWDLVYSTSLWTSSSTFYSESLEASSRSVQIDLFALSFLTPLEFNFIKEVSRVVNTERPLHFWILSPCLHFWSDLASDKEKKYLLSKAAGISEKIIERFEELLEDTNPLLSNFGKMKRELIALIETELPDHSDCYLVSEETLNLGDYEHYEEAAGLLNEPSTLLKFIQTDLLYLKNPKTSTPQKIHLLDNSLQFHNLPSKLREVEWARDLCYFFYEQGKDDIIIVAPDIDDYVPYIESVFKDFNYSLTGQKTLKDHPLHLLLVYYSNSSKNKVLLKLATSANFDLEELLKLEDWKEKFSLEKGSIDPLMHGFMHGHLEASDLELIQKWDQFLNLLKEKTPPKTQALYEWADWLESLPVLVEDELTAKLRRMTNLQVSYYSFSEHIKHLLANLRDLDAHYSLGQIRFSSISEAAALPAQVILVLGLSEGSFPKQSSFSMLDLAKTSGFLPKPITSAHCF